MTSPITSTNPQKLAELTEINLQDMIHSFGWKNSWLGRKVARIVFRKAAEKFARQVLDYDADVETGGLAEGSRRILSQFVGRVILEGEGNIPRSGPVVILSNHPGMTDTVALFASIPRADIRILAAARPFLRLLEATSRRLIFVPEGPESRFEVLRTAAEHLRNQGALLTFPAGKIEPDPAVLPGSVDSLAGWNPSIGLFSRMVPGLMIVPVIVSGVIARQAVFHPLTRLRRSRSERESLGASLQLLMNELKPDLWPVTVRVRFAPPISASELTALRDPALITAEIVSQITPFLEEVIRTDCPT
jgi:1-acyl-sn-glycerol-3-phosphate acyltransferase